MLSGLSKTVASASIAIALCVGPTMASAPGSTSLLPLVSEHSLPPPAPPLAALSAFGSQASAQALCGTAVSAVTTEQPLPQEPASTLGASAATQAAQATQEAPHTPGCVLPVVDQPAAAVSEVAPLAGLGIGPLLAALGLTAGTAAAIGLEGDTEGFEPISPD